MNIFSNAWVINSKKPLDCHKIDYDNTKPIYLVEGREFPEYDPERMFLYRLSNKPSEEYIAKHPEEALSNDGQLTIFDFM